MNDEMKSGRITGNPLGQRDPGRQAKGRDILIKKLKTVKDPSERDRILSSLSGRENLVTPETSAHSLFGVFPERLRHNRDLRLPSRQSAS